MAVTKTLFKAWSLAVSAAASECVNATLNATLPAVPDTGGGTAVDSKGNVWFTSIDGMDDPGIDQRVVIWRCPEDGECVSKRTRESPTRYVSREIAVDASGAVFVVYLLLPQVMGPARVRKCVWDDNSFDEEISCSQFVEDGTESKKDYRLALNLEGNVFFSHASEAYKDNHYVLRKCSPSAECVDFGGDFWDLHGFAPNHVAFDLQGNLYVTRKTVGSSPGFSAGDTLVAKCTSSGECSETQITVPTAHAHAYFTYEEIAVSPDDYIYMMVHDRFKQWLIQCSPDSVCNQVVTFDDRLIMTGLSAGKQGDLYTEVSSQPSEVIRLCVPPQIDEIQV